MSDQSTNIEPEAKDGTESISWAIHPMRESPLKAILFWAFYLIVVWSVYWNIKPDMSIASSLNYTFIAGIVLLAALSSFYLPTRFTIDESGVTLKRWFYVKLMPWERIRSVVRESTGMFISPFPMRRRLENYRGIYLYYRDNHEEVELAIACHKPDLPGLRNSENDD